MNIGDIKISTKGGDKGYTSLFSGERVSKNHPAMRCQAELDMLDSTIGLIYEYIGDFKELSPILKKIQKRMIYLKGEIATHPRAWPEYRKKQKPISKKDVEYIDNCSENIKTHLGEQGYEVTGWVMYGSEGHLSARFDHLRAECRKCEVMLYDLDENLNNASISEDIKQYINRLSDFFYLLARYVQI